MQVEITNITDIFIHTFWATVSVQKKLFGYHFGYVYAIKFLSGIPNICSTLYVVCIRPTIVNFCFKVICLAAPLDTQIDVPNYVTGRTVPSWSQMWKCQHMEVR